MKTPFPYASRTGTRRNLAAMRQAGWGLMVSAKGVWRTEGFQRYALDNGAWWAYQQRKPFDEAAFLSAWRLLGASSDFVVLPDIVAGGMASLNFSIQWLSRIDHRLRLLAVQDGMTPRLVAPFLGPSLGIFVGGSTEWKEHTLTQWGSLAKELGIYLHVGRVNSRRRISLCTAAGADSFDGSSVTRFAVTLPRLDLARWQGDLLQ